MKISILLEASGQYYELLHTQSLGSTIISLVSSKPSTLSPIILKVNSQIYHFMRYYVDMHLQTIRTFKNIVTILLSHKKNIFNIIKYPVDVQIFS